VTATFGFGSARASSTGSLASAARAPLGRSRRLSRQGLKEQLEPPDAVGKATLLPYSSAGSSSGSTTTVSRGSSKARRRRSLARASRCSSASVPDLHAAVVPPTQALMSQAGVSPPPSGPPPAVPQSLRMPGDCSPGSVQAAATQSRLMGPPACPIVSSDPSSLAAAGLRLPPVSPMRPRKVITVHSHYHLHWHVFGRSGAGAESAKAGGETREDAPGAGASGTPPAFCSTANLVDQGSVPSPVEGGLGTSAASCAVDVGLVGSESADTSQALPLVAC